MDVISLLELLHGLTRIKSFVKHTKGACLIPNCYCNDHMFYEKNDDEDGL